MIKQDCNNCGWASTPGDTAIGRCPKCSSRLVNSEVEAPKKVAKKKAAPKKVKSED